MNPEDLARSVIGPRCKESGKVYYSPASTLRESPFMLLGHNPGGTPGDSEHESIEHTLRWLHVKVGNDYLHDNWGSGVGGSRLQRSVQRLFSAVDVDLDSVFTTNLIFFRSQDVAKSQFVDAAPFCWQLHLHFLSIVQPELIIVFGTSAWSPFSFLAQMGNSNSDQRSYDAGHGDWKIRSFSAIVEGRRRQIFGFPHLSRYMTKPGCEGVVALREAVAKLQKPNKAPEPTPGAVTPRATEGTSR
jgi:hypothetical protein